MLSKGHHSLGAFNGSGLGLLAGRQSLLWNKKHPMLLQSLLLSCGGEKIQNNQQNNAKKSILNFLYCNAALTEGTELVVLVLRLISVHDVTLGSHYGKPPGRREPHVAAGGLGKG